MSATPACESGPDAIVELCAFRVGDEEYVLDLRRIREILLPQPVTPLPSAPPFVEGVIEVRGEVVPVIDVRKRLGVAPRAGSRGRILLANVAGRLVGLQVDAVVEVVRIPRSAIGPAPVLGAGPRLFLGVCGARDGRPAPAPGGARAASRRIRLLLNVKVLLAAEAAPAGANGGANGERPTVTTGTPPPVPHSPVVLSLPKDDGAPRVQPAAEAAS